jgi:hypothetical protein
MWNLALKFPSLNRSYGLSIQSAGTQDAFIRFAELLLTEVSRAWQIANPECPQRVQNLLFEDGLTYSQTRGISNRSKVFFSACWRLHEPVLSP